MKDISANSFYAMLIEDLTIEAEKAGMQQSYYQHRSTVDSYRPNQHEPKTPFTCSHCSYFCAHNYIIGKKPKRCPKCHKQF